MIIDGILTKGEYSHLPVILAPLFCLLYAVYNTFLGLAFDIVPYNTPVTDPRSKPIKE